MLEIVVNKDFKKIKGSDSNDYEFLLDLSKFTNLQELDGVKIVSGVVNRYHSPNFSKKLNKKLWYVFIDRKSRYYVAGGVLNSRGYKLKESALNQFLIHAKSINENMINNIQLKLRSLELLSTELNLGDYNDTKKR